MDLFSGFDVSSKLVVDVPEHDEKLYSAEDLQELHDHIMYMDRVEQISLSIEAHGIGTTIVRHSAELALLFPDVELTDVEVATEGIISGIIKAVKKFFKSIRDFFAKIFASHKRSKAIDAAYNDSYKDLEEMYRAARRAQSSIEEHMLILKKPGEGELKKFEDYYKEVANKELSRPFPTRKKLGARIRAFSEAYREHEKNLNKATKAGFLIDSGPFQKVFNSFKVEGNLLPIDSGIVKPCVFKPGTALEKAHQQSLSKLGYDMSSSKVYSDITKGYDAFIQNTEEVTRRFKPIEAHYSKELEKESTKDLIASYNSVKASMMHLVYITTALKTDHAIILSIKKEVVTKLKQKINLAA